MLHHEGTLESIHRRIQLALPLIVEAYVASGDVNANKCDFAVEIEELRRHGATLSDLRWMICKGLVEHVEECGGLKRRFRHGRHLTFTDKSCFVLTPEGRIWSDEHLYDRCTDAICEEDKSRRVFNLNGANGSVVPSGEKGAKKPVWDPETRQLYFDNAIVKQFRSPATNQIRVIEAFHELAWPRRIDDPLPPASEIIPKKRLHDAINAFNRNQTTPLIRFRGDGTGEGIIWEVIEGHRGG